jgi:hypothetical protein
VATADTYDFCAILFSPELNDLFFIKSNMKVVALQRIDDTNNRSGTIIPTAFLSYNYCHREMNVMGRASICEACFRLTLVIGLLHYIDP